MREQSVQIPKDFTKLIYSKPLKKSKWKKKLKKPIALNFSLFLSIFAVENYFLM